MNYNRIKSIIEVKENVEEQKNLHYYRNYPSQSEDLQIPHLLGQSRMNISVNMEKRKDPLEDIEHDFFETIIKNDTSQILEEKLKESSANKTKNSHKNEQNEKEHLETNEPEPKKCELLLFDESEFFNYNNGEEEEEEGSKGINKNDNEGFKSEEKNKDENKIKDTEKNEESYYKDFHKLLKENYKKNKSHFKEIEENTFIEIGNKDYTLYDKYLSFLTRSKASAIIFYFLFIIGFEIYDFHSE